MTTGTTTTNPPAATSEIKKKRKTKKPDKNVIQLKSHTKKLGYATIGAPARGASTLSGDAINELALMANFLFDKIGTNASVVQKQYANVDTLNAKCVRAACGLILPKLMHDVCKAEATRAHNKLAGVHA